MLATLCLLLPAVVVGADAQTPMRALAGQWTTVVEDGVEVTTHDAAKWDGREGFPFAVFDPPVPFDSGTATVEFKLIDGDDDFSAGLAFGYRGGATYYYVRYNTKDGNVALWRMDGPKRSVITHGEAHEQLSKGEWHRLTLHVDGPVVRAVVNGRLSVEHTLNETPSGVLGLWTKPTATSAFRGLRVERRR